MSRKPVIITIIALCYLLSPLFIIFQSAVINNIPIFGYGNIFERFAISDIITLLFYPVCAVCILIVKKPGWYIFILSSLYLIYYNIYAFILSGRYSIFLIIFYNIILFIVTCIFFRKHIIAPYFNPKLRWWEADERYTIDIKLNININNNNINNKINANILDLSETGCFIASEAELKPGLESEAVLSFNKNTLKLNIRVIRKSSKKENYNGYGLMFINLSGIENNAIKKIIYELEELGLKKQHRENFNIESEKEDITSRYKLCGEIVIKSESESLYGRLLDISKSGCFALLNTEFNMENNCNVEVSYLNYKFNARSEIRWKADRKSGIKFLKIDDKSQIKNILKIYKKLGIKRHYKTDSKRISFELIEKTVRSSPYRLVLFIKEKILKRKSEV